MTLTPRCGKFVTNPHGWSEPSNLDWTRLIEGLKHCRVGNRPKCCEGLPTREQGSMRSTYQAKAQNCPTRGFARAAFLPPPQRPSQHSRDRQRHTHRKLDIDDLYPDTSTCKATQGQALLALACFLNARVQNGPGKASTKVLSSSNPLPFHCLLSPHNRSPRTSTY